jgi:uncharacterized protein (TIGR00156 family)
MRTTISFVALMIAITPCSPALAEFQGPTGKAPHDVKGILANPPDDKKVTLRGHLVRQQSGDRYLFNDGTGEIRVEIDRWRMPHWDKITPTTYIEIYGEVETHTVRNKPPKIEVKRITILPAPEKTPAPGEGPK